MINNRIEELKRRIPFKLAIMWVLLIIAIILSQVIKETQLRCVGYIPWLIYVIYLTDHFYKLSKEVLK